MPYFQTENEVLPFRLRRSMKAKRLHIVFKSTIFEIVAPPRISNKQILAFAWQQRRWMQKQLQHRNPGLTSPLAWPVSFVDGEMIPFRAKKLLLQVKYSVVAKVELQESTLVVEVPWKKVACDQIANVVKAQVIQWYKLQALDAIKISMDYFCPQLGRWPSGYQLKQQKTRWGSCGVLNKININWLLLLAPLGVLEYVVAHELCHLFHRNHGQRFWAKVASCFPEYEQYERWLRKYGHYLQALKA
jgi:hypothetical protein